MTPIHLATRILLAPALVVALLADGFATPAPGVTAVVRGCCQAKGDSACCGSACCEARAPRHEQAPADPSRAPNDRPDDGKATWTHHGQPGAGLNHTSRCESLTGLPSSGSPSLVTQHVRLQI